MSAAFLRFCFNCSTFQLWFKQNYILNKISIISGSEKYLIQPHNKMSVLAEKSEEFQLQSLRQFYIDRGVSIDKNGKLDVYQNLLELLECGEFIASLPGENDVELLLNSFFSLIITTTGDEALKLVQKFCELVTNPHFQGLGWQSHAGVAVRVLSSFFHLHESNNPSLQFIEYKHLLVMCGRARLTNFIDCDVSTIEEYAKKWNLNIKDKREIFRLMHTALIQDNRPDKAAEIMTTLLLSYTEADADSAQNDARECVRTAVIDQSAFMFDHLLQINAVKRLEKTDPLIHEILKIFVNGTLADYRKFVAKNPFFVKDQLKVDEVALEKKVKTLTLISMAEKNQVIPMESLKAALDIKDDADLEQFIIDAIRIKAIKGKINEINQELFVSSFQYRTFDRPQWELLQRKLSLMLNHLKDIEKEIHENVDLSQRAEIAA